MATALADRTLAIERAREEFLAVGTRPPSTLVRPAIAESWQRSTLHGLDHQAVRPVAASVVERDNQVARTARPVVETRLSSLQDLDCGITLTDSRGRVLERWVESAAFERRLSARGVLPGSGLAESDIGTASSGIVVETGESVLVVGAEHFADGALSMSTAGAPLRHPITRQLVGTLNLTCRLSDTNALMLAWIRELAGHVESRLLDEVSYRERILMDTYLRGCRDSRHPVICMNETSVVGNASAIRLLGDVEQAELWEAASRVGAAAEPLRLELATLSGGAPFVVDCRPVRDGGEVVGTELRMHRNRSAEPSTSRRHTGEHAALPGLVGRTPAWQLFCRELTAAVHAGDGPVLVVGEPGTGKTATLAALGPGLTLDAAAVPPSAWEAQVRDALDGGAAVVAMDNLHALDRPLLAATLRLLADRPAGAPRVVATSRVDAADQLNPDYDDGLAGWLGATIRIPPIRERLGDLRLLLQALTAALAPVRSAPVWTAEAVQALSRVHWIANVASLARVVRMVLPRTIGRAVGEGDLPPAVRSMATRRTLSGLDLMEAHAITSALLTAEGNRKLAAARLGIARSTLYRKVRALGIDLSGAAY